jgi:hypothetical protein
MIIPIKPRRDVKMKQEETYGNSDDCIVIHSFDELQLYGLAIDMQNHDSRIKGDVVVSDMPKLEEPAEEQKPFLGSSSIHDRSELEEIAQRKELMQMDSDGLYAKLNLGYVGCGEDRCSYVRSATRWDGTETTDIVPYIAHYVSDKKQRGAKISSDMGMAILGIDKKSMEEHYGKELADRLKTETLKLMANKNSVYKVA